MCWRPRPERLRRAPTIRVRPLTLPRPRRNTISLNNTRHFAHPTNIRPPGVSCAPKIPTRINPTLTHRTLKIHEITRCTKVEHIPVICPVCPQTIIFRGVLVADIWPHGMVHLGHVDFWVIFVGTIIRCPYIVCIHKGLDERVFPVVLCVFAVLFHDYGFTVVGAAIVLKFDDYPFPSHSDGRSRGQNRGLDKHENQVSWLDG